MKLVTYNIQYAVGLGVFSDRDWSAGQSAPPMPANAVLLGDFNMEPVWTELAV